MSCSVVLLTKKGLLKCKPEWNREAVTVFSRLPSLKRLQATPPLQTSLISIIALKGLIIAKAQFELLDLMQEGEFLFHNNFKFQNNRWRLRRVTDFLFNGPRIFFV